MTYPSFLPIPNRSNYSAQPGLEPARFKMEDGQYRQKRQSNRSPFRYTLSWAFDWQQARLFAGWLEYSVIRTGVDIEIPIGGKTVSVRPVNYNPTYTPTNGGWSVQMEVEEIQNGPTLPAVKGLPTWPASLPDFETEGFTFSTPDAVSRSDIDNGLAETRLRFRDRRSQYQGNIYLDPVQRDAFWSFWRDTLLNGQRFFLAPFANPESQDKYRARLITAPVETPQGSWYSLALQLEAIRVPIMSYTEYLTYSGFINTYVDKDYVEDGYVGYWG